MIKSREGTTNKRQKQRTKHEQGSASSRSLTGLRRQRVSLEVPTPNLRRVHLRELKLKVTMIAKREIS
jgi:BRCT domain type II-containing protein